MPFLSERGAHYCGACRIKNERREARRSASPPGITARAMGAAPTPALEGGIGPERSIPGDDRAALIATISRHPAGRPRLVLVKDTDTCPHGLPALSCEGCIRASEVAWEMREDPA